MKKIFFLLACLPCIVKSQTKGGLEKNLNSEDSTALLTIASYPDTIRLNILEACLKPEILVKAENLQKSSSQSFREVVSEYTKEEQSKFWDLSRYPGLIEKIGTGEKKSKDDLERIASEYPSEIRSTILEYGKKNHSTITEINNLNIKTNEEFEKILAAYPDNIKTAYRKLSLHAPEGLNTLATNMHLAVMLGDMYKSDPNKTIQLLDSVKKKHEEQSAANLEDWKSGLEKNPGAKRELEKAAKEFAKENKSDEEEDDVYRSASDSPKTEIKENPAIINYVVQPYPYWVGYPWWYDYPYWRPYPYWYHTGFYYGSGGITYIGLPSPYFMQWYFFHPYHHYYYSHFTDYSLGYHSAHYGPRHQSTGFNSVVNRWSKVNGANLPRGYLNQDAQRPERIKELGRFEMDYHNNTKGMFGKNLTRPQFLRNNRNYYPRLNPVIKQRNFDQPIKYPRQESQPKSDMQQHQRQTPAPHPRSSPPRAPLQKNNGGIKKAPR